MAVVLTIAGATKQYVTGSLQLQQQSNGRTTASLDVRSNDGSYRPALDAEVILTVDGTRILGGLVDKPSERGTLGDQTGGHDAIKTRINVVDFNAYPDRRIVIEEFASQTLKTTLQTLVTDYLSVFGVTLHASQVDGPTLPALNFQYRTLSDVLNELATLTGKYGNPYVWRIDHFKVLRMYQPSTSAAPFNITEGGGKVVGDLTVDVARDSKYANRVYVKAVSKTASSRVETFTGDGTTYSFALNYTLTGMRYTVEVNGVSESLTFAGIGFDLAVQWLYYAEDNTIRRLTSGTAAPPANGATISITFDGTFSGDGVAEDSADIASNGPFEKVVAVEDIPSDTTIEALADGYLAEAFQTPKTIRYKTFESGLEPGQTQTVTYASRNLSGVSAVITDITTKDYGTGSGARRFQHAVTLTAGARPQDAWRDVYKTWAGDKTGKGAVPTATVGAGAPAVAGAAPPHRAVQFNNNNAFGGDASFIYYQDQNSIVCGVHSSITATSFESCQVWGYDNHIADP